MKIIQGVVGHYEIQEVEHGCIYIWCPESVLIECVCGERLSLTPSVTTCSQCGADYSAILKEELPEQQLSDEMLHPWRYGSQSSTWRARDLTPPDNQEKLSKAQKPDDTSAALDAARARNLARLRRNQAKLEDECWTSDTVQRLLPIGAEKLRQLCSQGKLVAIAQGERQPTLYPAWQFTDTGTIEGLEDLIEASKEVGMSPETLHFFMTKPKDMLGSMLPADVLRQDGVKRVVDVLRSVGLGPF